MKFCELQSSGEALGAPRDSPWPLISWFVRHHVESYETVTMGTWNGAPKILESVSPVIYNWAVNRVLTVTPVLKGNTGGSEVVTSI